MNTPLKVTCNGITTCTCPHCRKEIKNHERSVGLGGKKIIPCEHCQQDILWQGIISFAFDL